LRPEKSGQTRKSALHYFYAPPRLHIGNRFQQSIPDEGTDKTMDFLAQIGYFGQVNPWGCSLYGLILLLGTVFVALNMNKPDKDD
jgi:hypothetical protein